MPLLPEFRPSVSITRSRAPSKESKPSKVTLEPPPALDILDALDTPPLRTGTPDSVIMAMFRSATKVGLPLAPVEYAESQAVIPVSPEFPRCPKCGAARYWIARGMVMCGSRTCYSAVRFILTRIEYHTVH